MPETFLELKQQIETCTRCVGLSEAIYPNGKETGLAYIEPKVPLNILFVAESPPRDSGNFFYCETSSDTKFRTALFRRINLAGLGPINDVNDFNKRGYFLADAINCRWDKNKRAGRLSVIRRNCSGYLLDQILTMKPKALVLMGRHAKLTWNDNSLASQIGFKIPIIVEIPIPVTAPIDENVTINELKKIVPYLPDLRV